MNVNFRDAFDLLKQTYSQFNEDRGPSEAAAVAYYSLFSIGPLLLIAVAIAGFLYGQQAAQGEVVGQIENTVGPQAAQAIQVLLQSASKPSSGVIATTFGVIALLLGATGVFAQLQGSLNSIWGVKLRPGQGIWTTVWTRLLGFLMVLLIGALLLVLVGISTALALLIGFLRDVLPAGWISPLLQAINFLVTFSVATVLFAAIYKVLPDAKITWRTVWRGAGFTALLFAVGLIALGFYFGLVSPGSSYGAASSFIILLLWVYYAAMIFFFGAEFTQVYARRHGTRVEPANNAMWIREPAQGMEAGQEEAVEARPGQERMVVERPILGPTFLRAGVLATGILLGTLSAVARIFRRGRREAGD